VVLADFDGDATATAQRLNISQPSISKRLAALRRLTTLHDGQPWLHLKSKRWRLTAEGERVRHVIVDLVRRYEQAEQFVAGGREDRPTVSIACGQQAASGFVRTAVEQYLREHPECRVRISTPRGKARIEGTAGGQFDMAIVTESPAMISRIARREMYVEELFADHFVLAAHPPAKSVWGRRWNTLPADRPVTARELLDMPMIVPEPDAARRQQMDEWSYRSTGQMLDVVIEAGGWQTILEYAQLGLGVGLVTRAAVAAFQTRGGAKLTVRQLDPKEFPPVAVRLVARKAFGKEEADLGERARCLRACLVKCEGKTCVTLNERFANA
jgi:DNA-binding transcriptional LysR family regulator